VKATHAAILIVFLLGLTGAGGAALGDESTVTVSPTGESALGMTGEAHLQRASQRVARAAEDLELAIRLLEEGRDNSTKLESAQGALEEARSLFREGFMQLRAEKRDSYDIVVEGLAIEHVLREIFQSSGESYVWSADILDRQPLTIGLKGVDFPTALRLVLDASGLAYRREEGVYVIVEKPEVVTLGGQTLPLLGAVRAEDAAKAAERASEQLRFALEADRYPTSLSRGITVSTSDHPGLPENSRDILVDLDVKDATLAEVGVKLSEAAGEAVNISVHDSVPKELKVTAKIYKMPLSQVLSMLVDQANLTYSIHVTGRERLPIGLGKAKMYSVHIVPKPELNVSGPGVTPRGGGGGGRHGGGGGSGGGGRGGDQ